MVETSSGGGFSGHAVRENRDAHRGQVTQLAWNCQGKKLATGSEDDTLKIWNVELSSMGKDKKEAEFALGKSSISALAWHPSHANQLATTGQDNLLKVYDVRTSKVAYTTTLKESSFPFMAWNPANPDIIAVVHLNSDTYFIDSRTQKVLQILPSAPLVNEVRFSKDGSLFFQCRGANLEVYSYPGLVKLHSYSGHADKVYSLDLTKDEKIMATGGNDGVVTVTDLETLTSLTSFFVMNSGVKKVGFSADGQHLAYFCQEDKGIFIEEWQTGSRASFLDTQQLISSMHWNPKYPILAYTGSYLQATRTSHHRAYGMYNIFAPKKT